MWRCGRGVASRCIPTSKLKVSVIVFLLFPLRYTPPADEEEALFVMEGSDVQVYQSESRC